MVIFGETTFLSIFRNEKRQCDLPISLPQNHFLTPKKLCHLLNLIFLSFENRPQKPMKSLILLGFRLFHTL
jgi:hypothetical protein